jgi:anti-sigma B factor antagonist
MEIQKRDDVTIIVMDDRFDASVAQKLKDLVRNISEQHRIKVIIDLARTRFIDSSGCGALVASLRAVIKSNGSLKIANPSAQAQSLFELTRLNKVFDTYTDVETALKSF